MANFWIGLSGLRVAQSAIEVIGTNITNAATDGYHRQESRISPMPLDISMRDLSGGGAEIIDIVRKMDVLLEREILRQKPNLAGTDQELSTLQTIESALGDLDEEGIGVAISNFFNALHELAAQPNSQAHIEQVAWSGEALASLMRNIAGFILGLKENLLQQAQDVSGHLNDLLGKIADYNLEINQVNVTGGTTNLLEDQRDMAVNELAELIEVRTLQQGMETGMVNVEGWGIPLVVRAETTELEIDVVDGEKIGVSVKGAHHYDTSITSGQVGALLNLYNNVIPPLEEKFNTLASTIIESVNELHVQGVGSGGSFTGLTGWRNPTQTFDEWTTAVEAGDIYVRVTDAATGQITRTHVLTVDPAVHTIQDIADALDAVANLNADNNAGELHVYADNGYKFDFMPAISTTPDTAAITGSADPTFSGAYTGDVNQTYTFTVQGNGQVGASGDLYLEVTDGGGVTVGTINIGAGYATGDSVAFEEGLKVAVGPGFFNPGDSFTLDALASSDTSGALAALGINTFFEGIDADTMQVADRILEQPGEIAAAISQEMTDNKNLIRLAELGETEHSALGGLSINDYYRRMITDVGQEVSSRKARRDALRTVEKQMVNQRDKVSGVDVNEEAARLIMFEQMFQAVSKFMGTQRQVIDELLNLV